MLLLLSIVLVASGCGPAPAEATADSPTPGPPVDVDATGDDGGGFRIANAQPLDNDVRLAVKIINLTHGLLLVSYLDYMQEVDACQREGRVCSDLIAEWGAHEVNYAGGPGFNRYMKSLASNPHKPHEPHGRVLADLFLRLADTSSGLDDRSLLDILNEQVALAALATVDRPPQYYYNIDDFVAPIVVNPDRKVILGGFPLWIRQLAKHAQISRIREELSPLDGVQRLALNFLLDRLRDELFNAVFSNASTLQWKVGDAVHPLVETQVVAGESQPRPRRIFVPTDGKLQLRGTIGNYIDLNPLLELQWYIFLTRQGEIRVDKNLFEHRGPLSSSSSDALLRGIYRQIAYFAYGFSISNKMSSVIPVYRGPAPSGQYPGAPLLERPFSHLAFVEGSSAQQRLQSVSPAILNTALGYPRSSASPNAGQELRRYLRFLSAYGTEVEGLVVPETENYLGTASRDFRPNEILKSGVFLSRPEASPLDSFLLTLILYVTMATTTLESN